MSPNVGDQIGCEERVAGCQRDCSDSGQDNVVGDSSSGISLIVTLFKVETAQADLNLGHG
jgi:hypothetical protein